MVDANEAASAQSLIVCTDPYLSDAKEEGEVLDLPDLESTVTFLTALKADVTAVAIDPHVVEGRRAAEHCLSIDVLLAKYLVREEVDSRSGPLGNRSGQPKLIGSRFRQTAETPRSGERSYSQFRFDARLV